MAQHPILISGSGPAGLLLGHALKKAGLPFRIFERDPALDTRAQGYRFRISGEGVTALSDNLTPAHFALLKESSAFETKEWKLCNFDALTAEAYRSGGPPQRNPAIPTLCVDRTVFRLVLARGLEDNISFNKEAIGYDVSSDGDIITAKFADGDCVQGSMLVAADGSWSKIRKQYLPDFVPFDTGSRWLYGKTAITPKLRETLDPRLFEGMQLVKDSSRDPPLTTLLEGMYFSRDAQDLKLPSDYIYWVLGSRSDRLDTSDLPMRPASDVCAALSKEITSDWHPGFRALFEQQDEGKTSILRIASMKPPLPSWSPSRIVLVGDAAHCMSPTAGIGASTALRDVAYLAKLWADEGVSTSSVGKYEQAMREWANKAIEMSAFGGAKFVNMRPLAEMKPFSEKEREHH